MAEVAKKTKSVRIGNVLSGKEDKDAFYIKLGAEKQKDPKYNRSVEIIVKDDEGNVLAHQKNGFISMAKPLGEKTPDYIQYDLLVKLPA